MVAIDSARPQPRVHQQTSDQNQNQTQATRTTAERSSELRDVADSVRDVDAQQRAPDDLSQRRAVALERAPVPHEVQHASRERAAQGARDIEARTRASANASVSRADASASGSVPRQQVAPDRAQGVDGAARPRAQEHVQRGVQDQSVRAQLDRRLPQMQHPWQRERVLQRAQRFEQRVNEAAREGGAFDRLRAGLPEGIDRTQALEVRGVASHFGPESMQVDVRDRAGRRRTFVQDSAGAWHERPDLAARADRGQIASAAPGRTTRADATATFAQATVGNDRSVRTRVPDDIGRFGVQPTVKPFDVGDTVQIRSPTGNADQRVEGQPHQPGEQVEFGRITGHDGRGNWTVRVGDRDVNVTDAELRRLNNPHVLRNGDRVHEMSYDARHADQQRLMQDWRGSREYRELMARRPGADATPDQRAAWERDAANTARQFINDRVRYPGPSAQERTQMRTDIAGFNQQLRNPRLSREDRERITGQRDARQRELNEAMAPYQARDRLQRETRALDRQIQTARQRGDQAGVQRLTEQRNERAQQLQQVRTQIQQDERYHRELERAGTNIGSYYTNGTGQCRHQAVLQQTLMQDLGIDSRMTRGAANEQNGTYRGEHMWIEATLSNGEQLLVDPTWGSIDPLRQTYRDDMRRIEVPSETIRDYDPSLVHIPGDNTYA